MKISNEFFVKLRSKTKTINLSTGTLRLGFFSPKFLHVSKSLVSAQLLFPAAYKL